MNPVKILINGRTIRIIKVSDADWKRVNYVDYIDFTMEPDGRLLLSGEFAYAHDFSARLAMSKLASA